MERGKNDFGAAYLLSGLVVLAAVACIGAKVSAGMRDREYGNYEMIWNDGTRDTVKCRTSKILESGDMFKIRRCDTIGLSDFRKVNETKGN